jgi:hypothetical protein
LLNVTASEVLIYGPETYVILRICFSLLDQHHVYLFFIFKTNAMHQFLKFILFFNSTLHVSDGLSVHHQESKTVHTVPGICHTDSADCLLAGTRRNCSPISFLSTNSLQLTLLALKILKSVLNFLENLCAPFIPSYIFILRVCK